MTLYYGISWYGAVQGGFEAAFAFVPSWVGANQVKSNQTTKKTNSSLEKTHQMKPFIKSNESLNQKIFFNNILFDIVWRYKITQTQPWFQYHHKISQTTPKMHHKYQSISPKHINVYFTVNKKMQLLIHGYHNYKIHRHLKSDEIRPSAPEKQNKIGSNQIKPNPLEKRSKPFIKSNDASFKNVKWYRGMFYFVSSIDLFRPVQETEIRLGD